MCILDYFFYIQSLALLLVSNSLRFSVPVLVSGKVIINVFICLENGPLLLNQIKMICY